MTQILDGGLIEQEETTFLRATLDEKTMNGVDVGCGGRKTLPSAIGLDVARMEATDLSCGKVTAAEWVGDGSNLPFKDGTLDYVVSRHVLEHMDDWRATLREWIRVLKPGGHLRIIVPNPAHPHHPGHGLAMAEVKDYLASIGFDAPDTADIVYQYSWGLAGTK